MSHLPLTKSDLKEFSSFLDNMSAKIKSQLRVSSLDEEYDSYSKRTSNEVDSVRNPETYYCFRCYGYEVEIITLPMKYCSITDGSIKTDKNFKYKIHVSRFFNRSMFDISRVFPKISKYTNNEIFGCFDTLDDAIFYFLQIIGVILDENNQHMEVIIHGLLPTL